MLMTISVFDKGVFHRIVGAKVKIECIVRKKYEWWINDWHQRLIRALFIFFFLVFVEIRKWPLNLNRTVHFMRFNLWIVAFLIGGQIVYVHCVGETKNVCKKLLLEGERNLAKTAEKNASVNPCGPHTRMHVSKTQTGRKTLAVSQLPWHHILIWLFWPHVLNIPYINPDRSS